MPRAPRATGRANDCRRCVSGATPPSQRRSKLLAQLPHSARETAQPCRRKSSGFLGKNCAVSSQIVAEFRCAEIGVVSRHAGVCGASCQAMTKIKNCVVPRAEHTLDNTGEDATI